MDQEERRAVNQDQRLKSIIISCLPDDIIESVISCETAKSTWTDLVHSLEGPSNTKENKIIDLKLKYKTFRAKPSESLLQTYTCYKTLLNELTNDGVTLSKHEMNVGFVNSLIKKWISFSQGLRNSNHTRTLDLADIYGRDNLYALKQAKLEAVTFQIQNIKLTKLNHALQDQHKEERKVNKKWLNSSNKVSQCISEQILNQKKKILGGEQLTESSSKNDGKKNPFIPASLDYDHEMVPKSKDWVERLNPDSKIPNFNTRRILVPEIQAVNECLQLNEAPNDPESSKEEIISLGTMKHTKPKKQESSNKSVSRPVTISDIEPITFSVPTEVKTNDQESKIDEPTKLVQMLMDEKINFTQKIQEPKSVSLQPESSKIRYCMKCKKEDHRTSDQDMYIPSLKSSQNYKAQPYQYASPSKQILKPKAKPYPPCTHCGFNDHRPDDCKITLSVKYVEVMTILPQDTIVSFMAEEEY
ncbi:hypothetical protein Tco_0024313 [Tanacetum coccineum]